MASDSPRTTIIIFSLVSTIASVFYAPAYGHGISTCLSSSYVRLDNVQFSSYNITADESITITGELKSLVNRELGVTFVPLVDRDKVIAIVGKQQCGPHSISVSDVDDMVALEWEIVNASYSTDRKARINMEPGATVPFTLEIRSTDSGVYHLTTAYIVANEIVYLGRGQTVHVRPTQMQLQECKDIGVHEQECSNKTITQKGFWIASQYTGIGAATAGVVAFIILREKRV